MWMRKDKRLKIAVIRRVTSRLRSRPGELVTRWPGPGPGQWETFSYFGRLPGDCSRYITFTSPAPLLLDPQSEVQWVEASLGRQQPALWHSAGYSDSTPAISNAAVHWRFSNVQRSIGTILLCTFITHENYIFLSVSAFACQTSNLDMFSKYWNYSMNQPGSAHPYELWVVTMVSRSGQFLYLCAFLTDSCINPNHNNKSKGHFKLEITTISFTENCYSSQAEYTRS